MQILNEQDCTRFGTKLIKTNNKSHLRKEEKTKNEKDNK